MDYAPLPANLTPEQLAEEVSDSAEILMATYGWNDLGIHGEMKSIIKDHLRMLNEIYNSKLKEKKLLLEAEILDAINYSTLNMSGFNEYKNGGCYTVTGVIVSDSFGNKFEFDSTPATNEYNQKTGLTREWFPLPRNLQYIPSYMWPQEGHDNPEQNDCEGEAKAEEPVVKKEHDQEEEKRKVREHWTAQINDYVRVRRRVLGLPEKESSTTSV